MSDAHVKVNIIRSWQEAPMFYFLTLLTLASFAFYMFFIGQTIFRLVAEKDIESQKRNLSNEISQLELATLSLNDTISIEKAYELGFVNAATTQYVAKDSQVSLR